jgi:hypothetical protein
VTAKLEILSRVNDAHTAAAKFRDDAIVGNGLADHRSVLSPDRNASLIAGMPEYNAV